MSQNKKTSRSPRHVAPSTNSSNHLTQGVSNEERLEIAKQLESKLAKCVKNKSVDTNEVTDIRTELCSHFCEVILSDPSYSMESDCIHRLWRNCFYAQITHLRGRLIKLKSSMKRKPEKSAHFGDMITRTEKSLKSFIDDAIQLYTYLATRYEAKMNETQCDGIVQNLHKLLIHSGDLHRYSNNVSKAELAYMKASMLAPGRGNPYNQLAVVSQLGLSKSCISLYWYCRSLSATYESFETSRSNMVRLFDFNQQWLQNNSSPMPPNEEEIPKEKLLEKQRQYKSSLSRYILAEFVHFHGKLIQSDNNDETLMLSSYSVLKKFKKVLQEQTLGEGLITKMVTINVYSCSELQQKSMSKSFALLFSTEIAEHIASIIQRGKDQMDEGEGEEKQGSMTTIKLLSPLLLFCEWLKSVQHDVDEISSNTFEKQATISFWKSIVKLANNLNSSIKNTANDDDIPEDYVLKEHHELKGFKPFSPFISHDPFSSFFKVQEKNDNFFGYLSTADSIQALDRFKSRSSAPSRSIVETKIRVERFLSFVKASLWTPSEMRVGGDENMIIFDSTSNKFVFRDEASIDSSDDNASGAEKSANEEKNDDVQMNEANVDCDDEDDFIVYNGMDTSDSCTKFEYNGDVPQNPSVSENKSNVEAILDTPLKTLPKESSAKTINKVENVGGIDINSSINSFKDLNKQEKTEKEPDLSTPSGEKAVESKNAAVFVNPPPGFDHISKQNEEMTNNVPPGLSARNGKLNLTPTAGKSNVFEVHKEEQASSDLHMLPSNILESIGINNHSPPFLHENMQPPPGFTKPPASRTNNLSHSNVVQPNSFVLDRIGGSTLLFGSSQPLDLSNSLNSRNDEIMMDRQNEIRTMNPFVTPFHDINMGTGGFQANFLSLSQNGTLEQNANNHKQDNFPDLRKSKFGYPGMQQASAANSWNPFV